MSMKNVVHWVYMRFNRKYLVFYLWLMLLLLLLADLIGICGIIY